MEQSCDPLAVEMIPGRHCDLSNYLAKRARTMFGACAEVKFPDYGTVLWSHVSRNFSKKAGKRYDLSTYFTKRAGAQFGACAEVHFPDYGTELWSPGN
jgi:hypothetical protein